ncbi:MAG: hypothetical protein ACK47E_12280 [Cyclobacteriaceae bacterium]
MDKQKTAQIRKTLARILLTTKKNIIILTGLLLSISFFGQTLNIADTINHLDNNTITKVIDAKSPLTISNGLLFWSIIFIASLILIILILTWLLVRREKALQLMAFSISPLGLKLSYELNKDEKMKSLAMDNITLQNEIKVLKSTLSKERWRSILMLITFFFVFILFYVFDKLKFTKAKINNVDDEADKPKIDDETK